MDGTSLPIGPASNGGRLDGLQIVRAVAALSVVFYHVGQEFGVTVIRGIKLSWGIAGVDLFFVISGFIIARTMSRCPTGREFAVRRIARILPLYWGATILVAMVANIEPTLLKSTHASLVEIIKSMLFIPYVRSSGAIQPVLFPGWTLNYEAFFYALCGLALIAKLSVRTVAVVMIGLASIGYIANPVSLFARFYTEPFLLEFVTGILVYELLSKYSLSATQRRALLVSGALLIITQISLGMELASLAWRPLLVAVPFALVVVGSTSPEPLRTAGGRAFAMLGDSSFALYLLHPFVMRIVHLTFSRLGLNAINSAAIATLAAASAAIALAIAVYRVYERPLGKKVTNYLLPDRQTAS